MNPKSKKYSYRINEMNKENIAIKQSKNKLTFQKQIRPYSRFTACKIPAPLQLKPTTFTHSQTTNHYVGLSKAQSKKIIGKPILDHDDNVKEKGLKLPKISKDDSTLKTLLRKRNSKSVKKLITEPEQQFVDELETYVGSKQSIRDILMNIVKHKQSTHLVSIDEEIDKLEALTRRYSCLRKDLISIQGDILTINLKQREREREMERQNSSHSSSLVFI